MENPKILMFSLTQERRQELLLEAAWHEEERRRILKLLGMVATNDKEDLW